MLEHVIFINMSNLLYSGFNNLIASSTCMLFAPGHLAALCLFSLFNGFYYCIIKFATDSVSNNLGIYLFIYLCFSFYLCGRL